MRSMPSSSSSSPSPPSPPEGGGVLPPPPWVKRASIFSIGLSSSLTLSFLNPDVETSLHAGFHPYLLNAYSSTMLTIMLGRFFRRRRLHVMRGYIDNLRIRMRSLKARNGSLDLRSGWNGPM